MSGSPQQGQGGPWRPRANPRGITLVAKATSLTFSTSETEGGACEGRRQYRQQRLSRARRHQRLVAGLPHARATATAPPRSSAA